MGGPIELVRQRIYIVPSKTGLIFGVLVFILFILAMNYNNSLVFALTFFFVSVYLVSMIHVHRNLQGTFVSVLPNSDVFCWDEANFRLKFENPSAVEKNAFKLRVADGAKSYHLVDVPPQSSAVAVIALTTEQRGNVALPRFSVSTSFPAGLFYAWCWVHLSDSCIVYPSPATQAPKLPRMASGEGDSARHPGLEDIAGIRDYQHGDSLKRIAWKTLAKGQGLKSLESEDPTEASVILDWSLTHGDTESRLAALCRWVLDCEAQGEAYGLEIPGVSLPINNGENHKVNCLRALALFGHE